MPTPPPGTGPYKIVDYVKGKSLTLVRNPYFHQWSFAAQPDGFPNVITWRPANAQAVTGVLSGGGDVVELDERAFGANTASVLENLHHQHPTLLRSDPQPLTDMEQFNTRVPPFNNVLARHAVNYATDRNELVRRTGARSSPPLPASCSRRTSPATTTTARSASSTPPVTTPDPT